MDVPRNLKDTLWGAGEVRPERLWPRRGERWGSWTWVSVWLLHSCIVRGQVHWTQFPHLRTLKKKTPISRDPLEVTQEDSMGLGVGTSRGRLRPSAPRAAILWGLAASFCARGGLPISEFWSTDVPKG